jgi:hypothetical protein
LAELSLKQLVLIQNGEILITKKQALANIEQLMLQCIPRLRSIVESAHLITKPAQPDFKLSRGDNYHDLPYRVLDYPRQFTQDNIFAGRIIFLWAGSFSVQFHLAGEALLRIHTERVLQILKDNDRSWNVGVNDDPWQHHFTPDNYQVLYEASTEQIKAVLAKPYLKLAKKIPLTDYKNLEDFAVNTYQVFFETLINNTKAD